MTPSEQMAGEFDAADALASEPTARHDVSHGEWPFIDVIVVHYNAPTELRWVLNALAAQTYPRSRLRVIVSDDGSVQRPRVPSDVRLVTQQDEGFRAARARNHGAAQGSGEYVLFLDGDTLPTPRYCEELVRSLQAATRAPEGSDTDFAQRCGVLAVGQRRYADFAGRNDSDVTDFLTAPDARNAASSKGIEILPDAAWLADGYRRTDDLATAGAEDWRLVISAVMGMNRDAFTALGGFDESFTSYGGEDWELAYRAWNRGVALTHAPAAVAWHNGPDAGARPGFAELKENEQLELAKRIPLPSVRGVGGIFDRPRVVVEAKLPQLSASAEYVLLESWLSLGDVGVWVNREMLSPLAGDPRVRVGPVPEQARASAQYAIELGTPRTLTDAASMLTDIDESPVQANGFVAGLTRHLAAGLAPRTLAQPCEWLGTASSNAPVDLESWARTRWTS